MWPSYSSWTRFTSRTDIELTSSNSTTSRFFSKSNLLLVLYHSTNSHILSGQRYLIGTETTPLPNKTVGAEVMQSYHDHFVDVGNGILDVPGLISTMALQPMPRNITSKAKALGGVSLIFYFDYELCFRKISHQK